MLEQIWMGARYFFLYPLLSFLPHPYPYIFARYLSRLEYRFNSTRRETIKRGMTVYLDEKALQGRSIDSLARGYFEVVFCDEIDQYLYLVGRSKGYVRNLRIEGLEHLEAVLKSKTVILLSSHFGGGFWLLPYLKGRGVPLHCLSNDLNKEDYPSSQATYYYLRLRHYLVVRATGRSVLYKRLGKEEIIKRLEEENWIQILYDVPSFLVRGKMELPFLGRKASFPTGVFSLARDRGIPVLFFFSFLDEGRNRRIVFEKPMEVQNVEACVRQSMKWIEKRVMERPDHWHFWSIADQFFSAPGSPPEE